MEWFSNFQKKRIINYLLDKMKFGNMLTKESQFNR